MFESGIKRGVTFISTAFFYTLSLHLVQSPKSKGEKSWRRLLGAVSRFPLYLAFTGVPARIPLQSGLGHPVSKQSSDFRLLTFDFQTFDY